jgi:hypothetical protein
MDVPACCAHLPRPVMPRVSPQKLLLGQKALVTGASSGIGRAIAHSLGDAGADVVINYVSDEDKAEALAEEIRAMGSRALALRADVSDESQVRAMFSAMLQELGTIDILVNNAGLQQDAPFHELTLAQWNKVLGVNLTGQFLCAREAVREGAHLRITALRAQRGPGIEFLEYLTPAGGRPLPADTQAADVWYWQINLCASQPAAFEISLKDSRWQLISGATELPQAELGWHSGLITRDPDGHASLIGEGTVCTRI